MSTLQQLQHISEAPHGVVEALANAIDAGLIRYSEAEQVLDATRPGNQARRQLETGDQARRRIDGEWRRIDREKQRLAKANRQLQVERSKQTAKKNNSREAAAIVQRLQAERDNQRPQVDDMDNQRRPGRRKLQRNELDVVMQVEFNAIPIVDGIRQCPTGDYSDITTFGPGCYFGPECYFGPDSHFGKHCYFDKKSRFGKRCTFGMECHAGEQCTFDTECTFGKRCTFGRWCYFDKQYSFGEGCTYGEGCSFEPGHITSGRRVKRKPKPEIRITKTREKLELRVAKQRQKAEERQAQRRIK